MRTNSQHTDRTVMIVDDEPVIREMLRRIVEISGYTVVAEANDGVQAVVGYRESHPRITLMDVCMPNKNGIDATREIVSFDANAKVVLVSGIHQKDLLKTAQEAGAAYALAKPVKIRALKEILHEVMEQ